MGKHWHYLVVSGSINNKSHLDMKNNASWPLQPAGHFSKTLACRTENASTAIMFCTTWIITVHRPVRDVRKRRSANWRAHLAHVPYAFYCSTNAAQNEYLKTNISGFFDLSDRLSRTNVDDNVKMLDGIDLRGTSNAKETSGTRWIEKGKLSNAKTEMLAPKFWRFENSV